MTKLSVNKLHKYYGKKGNITKAVDNISFRVEEGEFLGIMGASGSGKTTLLNCISTIDHVTSGEIVIDSDHITNLNSRQLSDFRRKDLGFVFQDYNLLDSLTAFENIALALTINKYPVKRIEPAVYEVAKLLEIDSRLQQYPYQLSGGEQQRVACARAIVTNPKLILADEPTGSLDSKASRRLMESFRTLNESRNSTILMVTHDGYTASFCSRIIFIKDGKIFNELIKGEDSRTQFFNRIMDVVSLLGGELNDL